MKYATATRCIALLALALVAACERNTETAPHCAADTIRCNDIHIERCEADGSAWRYISSCPSNAACDAGECVCPAGESCECPDSESLLLGECIQRSDPSRLVTARLHPQTVTSWLPTTLTVYAEASAEPGAVLAAIEAQGGAVSAYEASVRRYTAIFHDDTTAEALYEARAALHAAASIRLAVPIWLAQDDLAECPMAIETSCAASGHGSVPNDPWPTSDHLTWNTCAPDGPNWFLEAIHAPEAWARLGNEAPRVKIGVIDTRHVEHPDIDLPEARKRYLPTIWSELNEEMDAKAEVYFGFDTGATDNASQLGPCVVEHGLMVSSIAAAVGGNGLGGSGVLRNAELYYCQYDYQWATFGDCLKWLVDVQGVRVVNLSQGTNFRSTGCYWGQCDLRNFCIPNPQDDTVDICAYTANGVEQSCQEHDDCTDEPPEPSAPGSIWRELMPLMAEEWETYFEALQSDDWLLVQSLGNDAIVDATYTRQGLLVSPEWREHIVMATAHDRQEERPSYANYGPADISAPGGDGSHEPSEDIFVACHDNETGADTYFQGPGTSFAAPLVSGTLALAWSLYPELSAPDLKELVLEGGRQTGTVEMSGGMTTYNHPRLDMLGAIEAVQQQCVCEGRTVDPATGACVGTTGPAEDGCEGRCGKFTSGASCQCNAGCFEYGDCCADLCAVCGDSFADACGGECEPACGGLQCGDDDGCGSPCDGSCPDGESCQGGQCVAGPCVSDCDGKDCGDDDGCGSPCDGSCPDGESCQGGQCVAGPCVSDCDGKDCGDDDGCGSPCDGSCPDGESCQGGQCVAGPCVSDCDGKDCGDDDGCGSPCDGSCPDGESCDDGSCVAGPCTATCAGKQCGDDGCGGSCGSCGPAASCVSNQCAADITCPPDCDDMVNIPAGTFVMGCEGPAPAEDLPECLANQLPAHEVQLSAYAIDRFEVTNERYLDFIQGNGNNCADNDPCWDYGPDCDGLKISEGGTIKDGPWEVEPGWETHPVVCMSWMGAAQFCDEVGRRLCTEAEWEKAAKGPEGFMYPWGDTLPTCGDLAMHSAPGWVDCGVNAHQPVGTFPKDQSGYGVFDMAGNVLEYVWDIYWAEYYAHSPFIDPTGPDDLFDFSSPRTGRGGWWDNDNMGYNWEVRYRTTIRTYWGGPGDGGTTIIGFRCCQG